MADVPNRTSLDNPLHEEKHKVGQHSPSKPARDLEPKEPDNKTQHGGISEARKGSQPGLTGHIPTP